MRGRIPRPALAIFALALSCAAASAAGVYPLETREDGGTDYVRMNDVLRALDGSREMRGDLGVVRVQIGGEELALLDGSRLVRAGERSWTLTAPIRFREGELWVPSTFLDEVVPDVTATPITVRGGRLFVDTVPGYISTVDVEPLFDGREITILGEFPMPPTLVTDERMLRIILPGCLGEETTYAGDELIPDVRARPTANGLELAFELDPAIKGYTWRERSRDRLRLLLGDEPKGLEPLHATPSVSTRPISRILIDPARGGADLGAQLGGVREKWLTLELARVVADSLLARGYDVYLSRNEDRALSPEERAELANGWGASLFLSLAFDAYPGSVPDVRCVVHRPVEDPGEPRVAAGYRLVPWSRAQVGQVDRSVSFARWIHRHAGTGDGVDPVRVPSRLLEGLEMPAVEVLVSHDVVESGPWRFWRERFASSVARAVDAFAGRDARDRRAERDRRPRRRF